ncbi:transposase [Streptomyces sp. NBC_00386]|uniref:hypothetical protein n=1 Tax=Streptomyces sp. NBC_00386 TaxID=2975734 RepID=UPI002E2119BD
MYAPEPARFNSFAVSCDCIAHLYDNAADHPDRVRRYPSDMTDAEWAEIRLLLPVPAWLQGRGGHPEGYCHRQLLDAIASTLILRECPGFQAGGESRLWAALASAVGMGQRCLPAPTAARAQSGRLCGEM